QGLPACGSPSQALEYFRYIVYSLRYVSVRAHAHTSCRPSWVGTLQRSETARWACKYQRKYKRGSRRQCGGSKRARAKPIGIDEKNDAEKWVRRSTGSCEQGNNKPEQARDAGGRGRDEPCTSSSKLASLADRLQTRCRSAATARGRPRRTVANA